MFRTALSFLLRKTILRERLTLLEIKKKRYENERTEKYIYKEQIDRFNKIWRHCTLEIPFYINWQKQHNLPDQIISLDELRSFPVLTKRDIWENQSLILEGLTDYYLTSTGGTSGITVHFPTSRTNADEAYVNAYLGRSWWGIKPLDDILMFWGHSHLFGKGLTRYINQAKRAFGDFLIGTKRISSYSLDAFNVKGFYNEISRLCPTAIISYSSNIFKICKYLEKNNLSYREENLRGIILTSESVTKTDIELIEKYLNTIVINEYGMAETGAIAYSFKDTNNIKVFWDSFILTMNVNDELVITTIGNPIFPLINYTSEDKAIVKLKYKDSILALSEITGKTRDILTVGLANGSYKKISTIFFDHVLKFYPDIYSIHYRQNDGCITILLTSDTELDLMDIDVYIKNEINKEFTGIDFSKIVIQQLAHVEKTTAGKNKTLLDE